VRLSIQHFIATSVLAHTAVFAVWVNTQSHILQFPTAPSSAPGIEVVLETAIKSSHHARQQIRSHKQIQTKIKPPQQLASTQAIESAPVATTHAQNEAAPSPAAELQRKELRDRVLSKIRTHLEQYFVYPLLAQREGWQGRVLLGFSVEADGKIRNIHVAAGSGYPILDNSAVIALSRVQNLYQATNWMQGQRLELQMPVVFRLQGG